MNPVPLPKDEVRRCASCQQPAVVLVFEWKHTYSGVATSSSTRDFRCQACGAKFSLHPKVGSWTFIVLGVLMSFAILPLGFTLFGWMRLRREKTNPVVPGVSRPVMKFKDGPPERKCGTCGKPVALKSVTRRTSRGVPTGTEYEYACRPCNKAFVIESLWGHCFSLLSAAVIAAIALAFLLGAQSPGWRYGGGALSVLLTAFVVGQTGVRISNHFRYPVLD